MVDACGRGPHCCEFESRPEHHRLVAQLGRGNTLRPCPVSVRIRPSLPCARSPTGRGNPLKTGRVLVRIQPGAPRAPVADGEASGFQTRDWVFTIWERQPPHERSSAGSRQSPTWPGVPCTPVADGEASGFQTRDWVFESPLGCHAPQQQVASGRVATSVCAVRFRGGAPSFSNAEEWTSC